MMKAAGIYAIEHVRSGRSYIGSARCIRARWACHRSLLRKGRHHSRFLQSAWNKYGSEEFVFRVVLLCKVDDLLFYEQLCINGYHSAAPKGFNSVASAGSNVGMKHRPESIQKWRNSRAGYRPSAETIEKIRQANIGRKHTETTKKKMKDKAVGRQPSQRCIDASIARHTGSTLCDEHKKKVGDANRGKRRSLEFKQQCRERTAKKLNYEMAEEMRAIYSTGSKTQAEIAAVYGVTRTMAGRVIRCECWPPV